MLPHQTADRIHRKQRGICKGLPRMQKKVCDPIPGALAAVHFKRLMLAADMLRYGCRGPGFVVILVGKLYVKVRSFPRRAFWAAAETRDESIPPLRSAPRGTSLSIWRRTAEASSSSAVFTASATVI